MGYNSDRYDIEIVKVDESHSRIDCERHILWQLSDYFKFQSKGAKFHPAYKNKMWDGFTRLINRRDGTIPNGLIPDLCQKITELTDYSYAVDDKLIPEIPPIDQQGFDKFLSQLKLTAAGETIAPKDYQREYIIHAINNQRATLLSPTSSGKSLIAYLLCRHALGYRRASKILIVVPTIMLMNQIRNDFNDYGSTDPTWKTDYVHTIHEGHDSNKRIIISTFQSIWDKPKQWFDQFDMWICDEAHMAKAKSLTEISSKLADAPIRIGMTGTLDGETVHELTITGCFGPTHRVIDTTDLIAAEDATPVKITCLNLIYTNEDKKQLREIIREAKTKNKLKKASVYSLELKFISNHTGRLNFVSNLAVTRPGNTLLLVSQVDNQGIPLFNQIQQLAKQHNKTVFFVDKATKADERERIRQYAENNTDVIIVATYQIFSTGVNIRNLHNIIFASPSKSVVRILQSIGRVLRKHLSKQVANVYDISDNIFQNSSGGNYGMQHFRERLKIYIKEQFNHKIIKINL